MAWYWLLFFIWLPALLLIAFVVSLASDIRKRRRGNGQRRVEYVWMDGHYEESLPAWQTLGFVAVICGAAVLLAVVLGTW